MPNQKTPRLYCDHAATSFPKPAEVVAAIHDYLNDCGVPAGRGAYRQALEVERQIEACRAQFARRFGVPQASHVIWTSNGTESLNTAILGLCRPGDHVVSSRWEHNSVLRPLRLLTEQRGIEVTWLENDAFGGIFPDQLRAALRPETRLVILQHANNVTGVIQPIEQFGDMLADHPAFFIVDAAQSAGHLEIDVSRMKLDAVAFPGHKGLLGPLGTGVLCLSERAAAEIQPLRVGGTGTVSEDDRQPSALPQRLESGNLNVPGILGLAAGLTWLERQGMEVLQLRLEGLTKRLWRRLREIEGVRLFGAPPDVLPRTSVISLRIDGYDPQDAATILDDSFGIQSRAGLHCAPGVHRTLETLNSGGTLRLSLGPFHREDDVDQIATAIQALTEGTSLPEN